MWKQSEGAQLLRLWPECSASQIAAKLGRSKNAVIGRFHRLKGTFAGETTIRRRRRRISNSKELSIRREREAVAIALMRLRIADGCDRDVEIVRAHKAGAGQPAIGDVFGITRQAISLIVKKMEL